MENYKQNIVDVVYNFLVKLGNDNPQLQSVIEEGYEGLMQEINSIPMEESMDVDNLSTSSSKASNTSDSEVRKYTSTIFCYFLNDIVLSDFCFLYDTL